MAGTSTVPAAKAGILALLTAALGTVQVSWAHPGKDIAKEAVFMGDAVFTSESVPTMRAKPHKHDEQYTVPVWVDVLFEGNDAQAAETRMWAIVALVETALRNDESVSAAAGVLWGTISGKAPQEYLSDMGRGYRCRVAVDVRGRN